MHVKKCTLAVLALLAVCSMQAQQERFIRTIDLNADCVPDTLYGAASTVGDIPVRVVWGDRSIHRNCDSLYYASNQRSRWRSWTHIEYKNIEVRTVNVRSSQLNDDGIVDAMFVITGTREIIKQDSTRERIPVRLLAVVPAQRGLDTLMNIAFRVDTGFVMEPFSHCYLRAGVDVVTVQNIQRSAISVQSIPRLRFPVNVRNDGRAKEGYIEAPSIPVSGELGISIVPNPVRSDDFTIELSRTLKNGFVELYSLQGNLLKHLEAGAGIGFGRRIPLSVDGLSNGLYMVRVAQTDGISSTAMLILQR